MIRFRVALFTVSIITILFLGCVGADQPIPTITGVVTNVEYLMGNNQFYMVVRFDDKRVVVRKGWITDLTLGKEYEFTLIGDPNNAWWDNAKELK